MTDSDLELKVAKLELKPTDILVVESQRMLRPEDVERIQSYMAKAVPDGVKTMVLCAGLTLKVVSPSSEEHWC
ncbi:hypothetical protein [Oxalicibacterium faecigallinarum]|uniref:Uncharacterized protein n=1 Tax=Oxalicibacterium faecigallinarum TaxID=573741 RepID=A0A8J3AKT1_9BURK|nr:hypothetical protein [Oxalicibacterium faecigallinarum]GGI16422.1 hypothetical protein GCM10008066_03880 [Oxalicibacterium faecigallinarum]